MSSQLINRVRCFIHFLPTLMYEKEIVDLEKATSTLLLEEKRSNGGCNEASDDSALTVGN